MIIIIIAKFDVACEISPVQCNLYNPYNVDRLKILWNVNLSEVGQSNLRSG